MISHSTLRSVVVAVALPVLTAPAHLRAQRGPTDVDAVAASASTRPDTVRLAMSISGAVSVGSYQAGVNWAILQFLRLARDDPRFRGDYASHDLPAFELRAVTGASAGNVNTLLWALEWCTRSRSRSDAGSSPRADPSSSLFWQTWVNIGIEDMLPRGRYDRATMDAAVLNRQMVRRITDPPLLERLKSAELIPGCEVPIGITLTRTRPDVIDFQGLEVETQRFATLFLARVSSDTAISAGDDRLHFVQMPTHPDTEPHFGKLVRLLPPHGSIPVERVLEAVQASAAFPVALAPVALDVWYPGANGEGIEARSIFIDGGVFDNNPINLALGLYHHVKAPGPARVLYINPFRYRGALARLHGEVSARPPAEGGLAVVGEFLGGAVATARQYELQLLARERRAQSDLSEQYRAWLATLERKLRARDREGVSSRVVDSLLAAAWSHAPMVDGERRDALVFGSRAFPVFGEHLHGFAGFLGRPFREFDFYVGVYDGLQLGAREFVCDASQAAEFHEPCVRQELAGMILDDRLVPDDARRLLATLYDAEHPVDDAPAGARALAQGIVPPDDMDVRKSDRILLALHRAAATQLEPDDPRACDGEDNSIQRMLCRDGVSGMVMHFRHDVEPDSAWAAAGSVRTILELWNEECRTTPGPCRSSDEFTHLALRSNQYASRLVERILTRLEDVERGLQRDGRPHFKTAVTAVNAMYHTTHLRSRGRFEMSPSRPSDASRLWWLAPYSVGGAVGRSGWEARYRPTVNIGQRVGVSFPVSRLDDAERRMTDGGRYSMGLGIGVFRRGPIPAVALAVPEAGLEIHALRPFGDLAGRERRNSMAVEAYATLLGGFARPSIRLDRHRIVDQAWHVSVNFALSDLGGLGYWLWRSGR